MNTSYEMKTILIIYRDTSASMTKTCVTLFGSDVLVPHETIGAQLSYKRNIASGINV